MTEDQLDELRAQATKAAADVKQMKKDGRPKVRACAWCAFPWDVLTTACTQEEIMARVKEMQALRATLSKYASSDTSNKLQIDSQALEDLLRRRMFVVPSFEVRNCCFLVLALLLAPSSSLS